MNDKLSYYILRKISTQKYTEVRFKAIRYVTPLSGMKSQPKRDRQCMYKCNVEACWCNDFYHEKQ
jgi:hypothetical protein